MNTALKINIKNIQNKDAECVFNMMRDFYDSPAVLYKASDTVLRADIEACISKNPFIEGFVFETEGQIAGYGMIAKSFSTEAGGICIWIEDVYIKPEFRGTGIGKEFFKFIEERYKNSAARIRLDVEAENEGAIHMYKRCRYKELPYLQMVKTLKRNDHTES